VKVKNMCANGGLCVDKHAKPTCVCPKGTSGEHCQTKIKGKRIVPFENVCLSKPCHNNGKCEPVGKNDFICQCKENFYGKRCEMQGSSCEPNPCWNGGTCMETDDGGFTCTCTKQFVGPYCDMRKRTPTCYKAETKNYKIGCETHFTNNGKKKLGRKTFGAKHNRVRDNRKKKSKWTIWVENYPKEDVACLPESLLERENHHKSELCLMGFRWTCQENGEMSRNPCEEESVGVDLEPVVVKANRTLYHHPFTIGLFWVLLMLLCSFYIVFKFADFIGARVRFKKERERLLSKKTRPDSYL